mmetsp:Transcript_26648/g.57907  ORF Transcript_26648/g.57907 Transcript_26648/m.57907 type:complete len:377 (+) Transcript_26648:119-1249(+)|eukprot:CAMPEP_0206475302 /NCGR_PEP_ID=MMETSP0324_2-20121206/33995_1 /ASSEMBLY_ACC=CAM_ASM_000836 /TAXON_ID=2866 /ORGANISM="Crypthecodinium cohnii, Strain Seligo" /LENGTH=376 /DNA_ID=CAMNT_0053950627 /DNA_START=98 /DNA_END=1228 /DNA_ORIENTATION=-
MCFLIGATGPGVTATGEAFIAGVSDDPYLFRTFVRAVLHTANDGGEGRNSPPLVDSHLGTELCYVQDGPNVPNNVADFPPPFEVEKEQPSRGINSAGLAFTCALAPQREPLPGEELHQPTTFAELSHRLMRECEDVDGAIRLLLGAKAVRPAFSVLLADDKGELAHVEVGLFGCSVLERYGKTSPGVVIAVNCHRSPKMVSNNAPVAQLECPANNNALRLNRGWELAKELRGDIDVSALAAILSDHNNRERSSAENKLIPFWGHSICNHGTREEENYCVEQPPWGSVSGEIFQPRLRAMHYCYGWPCGKKPQHGDQLFQERSWGSFQAFALPTSGAQSDNLVDSIHMAAPEGKTVQLTTIFGELTPEAAKYMSAEN